MSNGTVKWFNAEKAMVSSPTQTTEKMYSYITLLFRLMDSRHYRKASP